MVGFNCLQTNSSVKKDNIIIISHKSLLLLLFSNVPRCSEDSLPGLLVDVIRYQHPA